MCGIIGYVGEKEALPILLDGLRRLEYRGYDSAGVAVAGKKGVKTARAIGKVAVLASRCERKTLSGMAGIGHTRWATHGKPATRNTHPHTDCTKSFFIAHNGIIENHEELRTELTKKRHIFKSETDSEIIAHLIEEEYRDAQNLEKAVQFALLRLRGTYGLAVMPNVLPGKIIAARMGAPIAIGLGEGENFVASDAVPLLPHTRTVLYLEDGEMAVVTAKGHAVRTLQNKLVTRGAEMIEWSADNTQKGGFPHFTLKEIREGPEVVRNTLRGRLIMENGLANLGGLQNITQSLHNAKRIIIVGCGTALHAARVGEYMIEEYAGIPVEVESASEFRYRKPVLDKETLVIAISQSGETADTLEAVREAKRKGTMTLGVTNAVGSSIARETDAGIYNHAGPEVSVLSTKAYISQLVVLVLLTMHLGRERQMSLSAGKRIAKELEELPKKIEKIFAQEKEIKKLAKKYAKYEHLLYLGRKYNFATAFEGALKVKEASYIHAEGCGAGEMKHGFIALIDKNFPTIAITPETSVYDKMLSNIQEIKARGGRVLAVATEGDRRIMRLADDALYIPKTLEMLSPILAVVPLQLFAYYLTLERRLDPDRPRNLAKSVTVE
ncbi:MAG: glutamine--fructose-6-phosphate aminotransferase [Candidatus Taylorbacteria bacterium RIFCSPHIGHO2_02_49_25]|uniref:Glutamine--fructose-6-phosphate aminotransferase [isomerizing] n=1 Tax=Candidatus Taylorbacteria bacterium RIFCSPHIGHO2_02_49_25 TaxID=1802305 RepID=A0A1G2MBK9_9BACT|nr:MAG: Isomerizing Glutamine-fructose-6-phosphate aminotransferase [Parcubacteria group bacterium GW2011_GWF2_50_9]OHA21166.1 MAG: glutamine--fructose-6-phosphate aminotransferase [Candidatus Taylorbacteria bacterium RIFCSPHIGHO2_01_FULL_49_60]OHA21203.1 MAG: glutamine--fructose-6-phosphate aminotransferase [Candidatus Taylorbacteria bacterium RIFCSPHIGHO2_02_49_25]OHA35215.1 MAG: glutamine--fructose-6-phosphate aminotransferase [Candidatus Taylorbacteria bacterium RIFCSPLOWO2_02_50_13]OHA3627